MNFFTTTTSYIVNLDHIEFIDQPSAKGREGHLHMRSGERIPCRFEDIGDLLQQATMPNTDPTACVLMADRREDGTLAVLRRMPVIGWRRALNAWVPVYVYADLLDGGWFALAQAGYVTPIREDEVGQPIGYEESYFGSESEWLEWLKAQEQ